MTLTSGERTSIATTVSALATTGLAALKALIDAIKAKTDTMATPEGTFQYTVTVPSTGQPIADVRVFATTDIAGANVVACGYTDDFGVVNLPLDSGTWYLWRRKAGYQFTDPDTEVIP
jgi:hypothetical protein